MPTLNQLNILRKELSILGLRGGASASTGSGATAAVGIWSDLFADAFGSTAFGVPAIARFGIEQCRIGVCWLRFT